ncbi:MAG: methyltransferase domain-containing protein [Chloroflexi bacterium]|nr:methyltransferase domain-containing protein [Chloroflexota bacterium]
MANWNPSQYLRFGNERLQPVIDLIGRIPLESPRVIYDLGCGTGSGTVILKERWPGARVTGVDSSEAMLEKTRTLEAGVFWQHSDLNAWEPSAPADLLFSNAVFHWLDDHHALFPRLMTKLAPGGVLAVQMPLNWGAPTHRLIAETVRGGPWRERLEPQLREFPVLEGQEYYDLLSGQASSIDMWETTYYHILEGQDPVVEWTKGSILRPLLDLLEEPEAGTFLEMYRSQIAQAYPQRPDGKTVLPFRRLFFMATKS